MGRHRVHYALEIARLGNGAADNEAVFSGNAIRLSEGRRPSVVRFASNFCQDPRFELFDPCLIASIKRPLLDAFSPDKARL
jgi:hypothetical protein